MDVCRFAPRASVVRVSPEPDERPRHSLWWRLGTPVVLALSGALLATSAASSDGTDLRPGRYTDLATLVEDQSREVTALTDRAAELNEEISALTEGLGDERVQDLQATIEDLEDPAGLETVTGEGITVTLEDASRDIMDSSDQDPNRLVVHQQDIQAVVNAMWSGGAEAITIQEQRVVSTTGIKCEGNVVLLHGVPYSQPYVISAIGDQDDLRAAIDDSDYLDAYRRDAATPDVEIGWEMEEEDDLTAPPYSGLLDVRYAEPAG